MSRTRRFKNKKENQNNNQKEKSHCPIATAAAAAATTTPTTTTIMVLKSILIGEQRSYSSSVANYKTKNTHTVLLEGLVQPEGRKNKNKEKMSPNWVIGDRGCFFLLKFENMWTNHLLWREDFRWLKKNKKQRQK